MTADAPPTRAQRFAAAVKPAAHRAGYTGHGANARLARDTGITESTISRMMLGQTIPDPKFFEPLARVLDLNPLELLVEAGIISNETLRSLSETRPSQVRSPFTPEEAATELGFTDPVSREMYFAMVERLKRRPHDQTGSEGGAAAEA
jgi:transcriptional regulator with XRE-family HTH domain